MHRNVRLFQKRAGGELPFLLRVAKRICFVFSLFIAVAVARVVIIGKRTVVARVNVNVEHVADLGGGRRKGRLGNDPARLHKQWDLIRRRRCRDEFSALVSLVGVEMRGCQSFQAKAELARFFRLALWIAQTTREAPMACAVAIMARVGAYHGSACGEAPVQKIRTSKK